MTPNDIRATVLRALGGVAPEADLKQIQPSVGFREQLDIDSMDFLNFVIGLHKELGVEIPERDYPKLSTLQGCMEYLTPLQDVQHRK
ncbi:MAG TPA: phosphopantetheine-binding protein [Gemmataceae bacterium]|nr:phosphopantetheine-binding protein [Gemmataceae bacterium]